MNAPVEVRPPTLNAPHLMTLTLDVAFAEMLPIGHSWHGNRRIAPITGGRFQGPRLAGIVLPGGADWVINRPDGIMQVDVRIALRTTDNANIYLAYTGVFKADEETMARFSRGALLEPHEYMLRTVVRLECGAPTYAWVNDMIAIGVGRQARSGPVYEIFEIR